VEVYATHGAIFPDLPADFSEFKRLLRSLSRTDVILWCARLNILVSDTTKTDPKDIQGHCVGLFFDPEAIGRINRFAADHGGRENVSVFFRGQLLELIRWACLLSADQPGDGETFNSSETRLSFVRAALLASEVWSRRVYGDRLGREGSIHDVRLGVLPSLRRSNMETAPYPHPILAIARGTSLFADRLRKIAPECDRVFQSANGLSVDDHMAMVTEIACSSLSGKDADGLRNPGKGGLFSVTEYERAPDPLGSIAREFFQHASQTADEIRCAMWGDRLDSDEEDAPSLNLNAIRRRPIFRASDGRAIVIDPRSFVEHASAGPLFSLVAADRGHQDGWFAAFGEVFEDYTQDIFHRIYPDTPPLVKRFTANPGAQDAKGRQVSLGDGILFGHRTAVLIEIKGVWMRDSMMEPDVGSPEYLAHLRAKYGVVDVPAHGDRAVKGVGQLARSIARLADGDWTPDNIDLRDVDRIIPVLLVHDVHVDAPVHSHILAAEFAAALDAGRQADDWSEPRLGWLKVAHLIVLTIDDLEALETSSRTFALVDCFDEYTKRCPDRMMSFHNFLAYSAYRDQMRYSAWLASRSMEVLRYAAGRLYPGSSSAGTSAGT